jgi:type IV secretory pathway VirD2 relaxase
VSIVEPDRPFRLRPRGPKRTDDNSRVWPTALRRVLQLVQTTCKRDRRGQSTSSRDHAGRSARSFAQRCAVRVMYSPNRARGQWAAHGRYVARESAAGEGPQSSRGFDASSDEIDILQTAAGWQNAGDPRMFKLIISPEFGERLDLKDLTRQLIRSMERDLNLPLEWVAVAHFNTEHSHAHVLLRGIAASREVRLAPQYIKVGIRKHAEDLCTAQLGYRTEADRAGARAREVDQPRFTSLDVMLRRLSTPENDSAASPEHFIAAISGDEALLAKRLHVLRSMGLAEPIDRRRWQVRKDFEAVLRSMKKTADRQQMLASCSALISDERLPMELTPASRITSLEGRVVGHVLDDTTGRAHMVLEGTDAKIHFIPHDPAIESARQKRLLRPNNFVELSSVGVDGRGRLVIEDLGSAEDYLSSMRFAMKARRRAQQGVLPSEGGWGGWLGKHDRAVRSAAISTSKDAKGGRPSHTTEPSRAG